MSEKERIRRCWLVEWEDKGSGLTAPACLPTRPRPTNPAPCPPCPRYILARIESTTGIRRGERVWQIAFGSGFKCNSAVWRALRTNACAHTAWAPVEAAE